MRPDKLLQDVDIDNSMSSTDEKKVLSAKCGKILSEQIKNTLSSTPITTDKAKLGTYTEGALINIENATSHSSGKKAQGVFQAVIYSEIPHFFKEDIPDIMYSVASSGTVGHTYLINTQLLLPFALTFVDETAMQEVIPFVDNTAAMLFNLASKKMGYAKDGKIEYLRTEAGSISSIPVTVAEAKKTVYESYQMVYLKPTIPLYFPRRMGLYYAVVYNSDVFTDDIRGYRYRTAKNGNDFVWLLNCDVHMMTTLRYHPTLNDIIKQYSYLKGSATMLYNVVDHKHTVIIDSEDVRPVPIAVDIAYEVTFDNEVALNLKKSHYNNKPQILYNKELKKAGLVVDGKMKYFKFEA